MAGVKHKSGGARSNAGGKRQGAGRPRKAALPIAERDMLQLLTDIALGRVQATALQVRAAIAAIQYTHAKIGESGKKQARLNAAQKANSGRFAPAPLPLQLIGKHRETLATGSSQYLDAASKS